MDLLFAPFIVLLNEEVQFGSDHIFLFDGMHALRAGLESFFTPPLIGDHFLNQFFCFGDGEVEKGHSSNSVDVGSRCHSSSSSSARGQSSNSNWQGTNGRPQ